MTKKSGSGTQKNQSGATLRELHERIKQNRRANEAAAKQQNKLAQPQNRWQRAVRSDAALAEGVNVAEGLVVYRPVAEAHGMAYTPLAELID